MTRRSIESAGSAPLELTIDSLGAGGDGIAHEGARRVFVPFTLPGERVRAVIDEDTAEGARARLVELLTAAPERAAPPCPHFGTCGGCALQHLDDGLYAQIKTARLVDALATRGLRDVPLEPLVRVPPRSRRRVRLAAVARRGVVSLGFRAARGRTIIDLAVCPIMTPAIEAAMAPLREALGPALKGGAEIEIAITETDNGLDVVLAGLDPGSSERRATLATLAHELRLARLSVAATGTRLAEPVAVLADPTIRFAGVPVTLPPDAFVQATAAGEAAIVARLLDAAKGARRAADLYGGLGALGLALARAGLKVEAFDSAPETVAALQAALRRANFGDRLGATRRDLARAPLDASALDKFDLVVFDPPRAGAAAQAARLAASRVPCVVAVSCNPATFARDARLLIDGGYRPERAIPLDQFLWSPHIEIIAVFRR